MHRCTTGAHVACWQASGTQRHMHLVSILLMHGKCKRVRQYFNKQSIPRFLQALPRVIEFGDTPDEPDFLNPTPQQAKKRKTHHATSNPSTHHTQEHTGSTRNQKHHQTPIAPTDKQQQLTQHKAGDLTHAEPNVPAEQRQQLFGDRSTAAATDSIDSHSWQGLGLAEDLADHLIALNFQEPTAVQQQTIPLLLRGRDACVRSPTGSGKTLCYLAPLIHTLQVGRGHDEVLSWCFHNTCHIAVTCFE